MTGTTARAVGLDLLPHLRRARDHIDRRYEMALNLDQLAYVARVSKFHFVRSFEAIYGDTPIRYLTRRRIEHAQDLLRRRDRRRDAGAARNQHDHLPRILPVPETRQIAVVVPASAHPQT